MRPPSHHSKPRARRFARLGALEVADRVRLAPSHHREHGAVRVRALDGPFVAGDCRRAVENLAAAGGRALHRRVDVADVEVMEPERARRVAAACRSCRRSFRRRRRRAGRSPSDRIRFRRSAIRTAHDRRRRRPPRRVAISSCQPISPGVSGAGGCGRGISHLKTPSGTNCGSVMIANRLTPGTVCGATSTTPPSAIARVAARRRRRRRHNRSSTASLRPCRPRP